MWGLGRSVHGICLQSVRQGSGDEGQPAGHCLAGSAQESFTGHTCCVGSAPSNMAVVLDSSLGWATCPSDPDMQTGSCRSATSS